MPRDTGTKRDREFAAEAARLQKEERDLQLREDAIRHVRGLNQVKLNSPEGRSAVLGAAEKMRLAQMTPLDRALTQHGVPGHIIEALDNHWQVEGLPPE